MTIMNNLPNVQILPEYPSVHLHSKNPPNSRQKPPFWHGFDEQAPKYMKYHNC